MEYVRIVYVIKNICYNYWSLLSVISISENILRYIVCVCVCVCVINFENMIEIEIIYKNIIILEFSKRRILRLVHI